MIESLPVLAETAAPPLVIFLNTMTLLARYVHIICTTLLVGGTLFYEMVVPIAIADLKPEQQLAIFARARWVFRRIVWFSAVFLVLTGILSTTRHWRAYAQPEQAAVEHLREASRYTTQPVTQPAPPELSAAMRPGWWWVAHASTGAMAILIALSLTIGRTPPSNPVIWMRLNLVVLMIVIFLASATRHVRMAATEPEPPTAASSPEDGSVPA